MARLPRYGQTNDRQASIPVDNTPVAHFSRLERIWLFRVGRHMRYLSGPHRDVAVKIW
jgi:hypothetical protein